MNEAKEIGKRLKWLRTIKKKTLEAFYGPITPYYNNFSAIENGKRRMGKRLLGDLVAYYNLNPEWIESGKDPVFLTEDNVREDDGVPYYDIDISNGLFLEDIIAREEPEYYVDFKPFNDCSAYITIYGDSMFPKYASGDIISIKKLPNVDVILWGEAYLVVTNETANNLCTVKIVHQHKDPDKIIIKSSNPHYQGDIVIPRSSIIALYMIKGKITRYHL